MTGWIADTPVECARRRFGGFVKVSLEEILIALRDERRRLNYPEGLLQRRRDDNGTPTDTPDWTLYADKKHVRIINFIDAGHPALLRMWDKRRHGY